MGQLSGVIPEADYAKNNPIRKIAKEILAGRKDPYSTEEIGSIVKERYLDFEPLIPLTRNEESFLHNRLVKTLQNSVNAGGTLRLFLESECYISPKRKGERQDVYAANRLDRAKGAFGLRLMSAEEKLAFMEEPINLESRWHEGCSVSSFVKMGYRNFEEYSVVGRFSEIIRQIRAAKSQEDLRILDLGGGIGLALSDIKKEYPDLITYNATRDEEFSHYPSDFHVVAFMERMPLALQGSIDMIFSNMTTRYLAYTDLVIQGCIAMLSEGGIMDVFFASERSENDDEDDVERRMKEAYDYLRDLESSGAVELEINHGYTSCIGGSFRSANDTLYPAAKVYVRKL